MEIDRDTLNSAIDDYALAYSAQEEFLQLHPFPMIPDELVEFKVLEQNTQNKLKDINDILDDLYFWIYSLKDGHFEI